jgi:3-deoxy-D-manno-octulosonic-acid transferase
MPLLVLRETWRRKGGKKYFAQRFGYCLPHPETPPIWLHAASVGEVNAAWPLLERLRREYPQYPFLITTNTATGARTALARLGDTITHAYLPLDYAYAVKRFLNAARPRCALIMETELWPNLYAQCRRREIPVYLLNGRLDKTLQLPGFLRPVLRDCLQNATHILARGRVDRENFIRYGANPQMVTELGNIKFAAPPVAHTSKPIALPNRPYVLAASTHADEEYRLAKIWTALGRKDHLLAIAPRYPERRDTILKHLARLPLKVAVRSRGDNADEHCDVYLLDTLGELNAFMAEATLVFMGGSLVPRGGQNLLEPARLGKAIITGPHTFTFNAEVAELLAGDALIQVTDDSQLQQVLLELLNHPDKAGKLGENASALMKSRQHIVNDYLQTLKGLGAFS